jgi:hypothetical protein
VALLASLGSQLVGIVPHPGIAAALGAAAGASYAAVAKGRRRTKL